jgi:ferredoxin
MVYVNAEVCNGCGECVSVCPNGAMILEDNHAFIDQELCQECEVCVDSCPQGAILTGEPTPIEGEVIKVPSATPAEIVAMPEQPYHISLQNAILPTIGSALMWTGRELLPRVADLALEYLDRRVQSSQSAPTQKFVRQRNCQVSRPLRGGGRGRRRQRRRRE